MSSDLFRNKFSWNKNQLIWYTFSSSSQTETIWLELSKRQVQFWPKCQRFEMEFDLKKFLLYLAVLMIVNLTMKVAELVWNLVLGLYMFALQFVNDSLVGVNFRMLIPDKSTWNENIFGVFCQTFLSKIFFFGNKTLLWKLCWHATQRPRPKYEGHFPTWNRINFNWYSRRKWGFNLVTCFSVTSLFKYFREIEEVKAKILAKKPNYSVSKIIASW